MDTVFVWDWPLEKRKRQRDGVEAILVKGPKTGSVITVESRFRNPRAWSVRAGVLRRNRTGVRSCFGHDGELVRHERGGIGHVDGHQFDERCEARLLPRDLHHMIVSAHGPGRKERQGSEPGSGPDAQRPRRFPVQYEPNPHGDGVVNGGTDNFVGKRMDRWLLGGNSGRQFRERRTAVATLAAGTFDFPVSAVQFFSARNKAPPRPGSGWRDPSLPRNPSRRLALADGTIIRSQSRYKKRHKFVRNPGPLALQVSRSGPSRRRLFKPAAAASNRRVYSCWRLPANSLGAGRLRRSVRGRGRESRR